MVSSQQTFIWTLVKPILSYLGKKTVQIPGTLSIKTMNEIIEHKQIVNFLGIYIDEKYHIPKLDPGWSTID